MIIVLFVLVSLIILLRKNIKHRKIKLIGVLILSLIIGGLTWEDGVKSYYCLSENKCITVWKRSNEEVYIIYGKYKGNKTPKDNYIKTTYTEEYIDVIFIENNKIIVNIDTPIEKKSIDNKIKLYNDDKQKNDSLYTYFDGNYVRYKKNINFINLNIKENYATDKTGKKIE